MARASAFQAEGRGFESRLPLHIFRSALGPLLRLIAGRPGGFAPGPHVVNRYISARCSALGARLRLITGMESGGYLRYTIGMSALIWAILIILIWALLALYLVFTVVAIFAGAAPIPSTESTVKCMMDLANIQPGELLLDLGSGDGRILIAGAKRGARCIGFEINPILLWYTRLRARIQGLTSISVHGTNLWDADIKDADILTIYMVPIYMERLRKKIQAEMKPGSRVISGVYPFPDWEPEKTNGRVYMYRVS